MTRVKTILTCGAALAAFAGLTSPASARTVRIEATGTFRSFVDRLGVYGTPGADYAGATIKQVFFFNNPVQTLKVFSFAEGRSIGSALNDGSFANSTVNGHTVSYTTTLSANHSHYTPGPLDILQVQSFTQRSTFVGGVIQSAEFYQQAIQLDSTIPGTLPPPFNANYASNPGLDCNIYCGVGVLGHVFDTYDVNNPGTLISSIQDNAVYDISRFSVSSTPEPASWAMMILGFGFTGAAMRRRVRVRVAARLKYPLCAP